MDIVTQLNSPACVCKFQLMEAGLFILYIILNYYICTYMYRHVHTPFFRVKDIAIIGGEKLWIALGFGFLSFFFLNIA